MMARNANVVILCEDRQQEAFARRFLKRAGYNPRRFRVEISPKAKGSAEQFVRLQFPKELEYYRSKQHKVGQLLIAVTDADRQDVADRIRQIHQQVKEADMEERQIDEKVAIFVPSRNIETWLAYLDGQTVNEDDTYPKLDHEGECQRHVDSLYEMCQQGSLRLPSPPSLDGACREYRDRLV